MYKPRYGTPVRAVYVPSETLNTHSKYIDKEQNDYMDSNAVRSHLVVCTCIVSKHYVQTALCFNQGQVRARLIYGKKADANVKSGLLVHFDIMQPSYLH